MKTDMWHKNGFTLIELIIVFVVLGIIAAFAIPRMINLNDASKQAVLKSAEKNIFTAATYAHAQWIAEGMPNSVLIEGKNITFYNGYPAAQSISDIITIKGFTVRSNNRRALFRLDNSQRPNRCRIRYRRAQAGQMPRLDLITTGC